MRPYHFLSLLFLVVYPCVSQEITIKGIIKDSDGNVVENALVRFESLGYVTVSTSGGGFVLSNSSPIQRRQQEKHHREGIRINHGTVSFTIEGNKKISFMVYSLQGRRCWVQQVADLHPGNYRVDLQGVVPSHLGSGTYIVSLQIGGKKAAGRVVHRSGSVPTFKLQRIEGPFQPSHLARQSAIVDNITISKLGYVSKSIPIESYQQDLGEIILETVADCDKIN